MKDEQPVAKIGAHTATILVVDDDADVRFFMRIFLEKLGYEVLCAEDGVCALDLYKQHQAGIDLVFLDFLMPGMDGLTLFKTLRRANPQVKCVMISGSTLTPKINDALNAGMAAFLPKPIIIEDLISQLETISSNSPAHHFITV